MRSLVVPAVALVLLAACGRAAPPDGEPGAGTAAERDHAERPPVVVISIDTLRADRLPAYGYDGVATPAIDALAADAVRFEHAFSHIPLTLPAHASLFSGLLPAGVGVRDNAGYRLAEGFAPYLPTLLRDAGYATAGAVSSYALRADTGIGQGFERYDDEMDRAVSGSLFGAERAGERTLAAIRPWLDSAAGASRPFFLFLHLYEPHQPYTPPEAFAERWGKSYEAEIAAADAVVGELLAALRAHEVYDRALIVLLSDHGEGLGDHGEQGHGIFLYREAIQVPLLLKLPGGARAGTAVGDPVRLIDVLPTVLEVAGIEPPGEVAGTSLLELIDTGPASPRPVFAETLYPRLHFGWSDLAALIEWPYAYIEAPEPELYDLESDPGQRHNVLSENRRIYADLRARLAALRVPFAPPEMVEDEETRKRLAALGYLAGASAEGTGDGPLPDPKHRLERAQRLLDEGLGAFDGGRFAAALPAFRTLVEENPGMVDAWENLGNALLALERPEEALEAYAEALERGSSPRVAFLMARALLRLGRLDSAAEHAELAASWDEGLVAGLRARIAGAWEARALAALEGGRPAEAVPALERALALGATGEAANAANAWNLLAVARFQLGDRGGAIEAWERAVTADPDHLDALYNLAFQAADLGRADLARRTLRRYLEIAPPERYGRELAQARALLERLAGP